MRSRPELLPLLTLFCLCGNGGVLAQTQAEPSLWDTLAPTKVSGSLLYFQRDRERYAVGTRRFEKNLQHSTLQSQIDVSTPYFAETLGVELGLFGSVDLANPAGAPDHEINFFPWENPWSADWSKRDAQNGVSLYRAHLKWQRPLHTDGRFWGKLGYFQPEGPGVLGVNWSLMPGTYAGAEGGVTFGDWALAAAWVTRYKAPWYRETYAFLDDEKRDRKRLWSLGARYRHAGLDAELAYGEAPGHLRSAHLKLAYVRTNQRVGYQFYLMGDRDDSGSANDHYDGRWGYQHVLTYARTQAPWNFRAEYTYSSAPVKLPQHRGYFVYRLSGWYGGAKGAYDIWWDNRSDWNHDRESAVFFSLSRTLDDLGLPGASAGVSVASGWGGRAPNVAETLREKAWSLDLGYRFASGTLKGASVSLHYTHYDNATHQPSWEGFKNLFQDERDVKLLMILPWSR
ncbi:MAG: OprD family porin [Zoogloeaceae bacterium]|jgi:hypothetical protein|nr:OprD family porin [Zoogloeaceae bacterium]